MHNWCRWECHWLFGHKPSYWTRGTELVMVRGEKTDYKPFAEDSSTFLEPAKILSPFPSHSQCCILNELTKIRKCHVLRAVSKQESHIVSLWLPQFNNHIEGDLYWLWFKYKSYIDSFKSLIRTTRHNTSLYCSLFPFSISFPCNWLSTTLKDQGSLPEEVKFWG